MKVLNLEGLTQYTTKLLEKVRSMMSAYIPLSGSTEITGVLRTSNEIQSTTPTAIRLANPKYGTIIRNDGDRTYFLLTNENDPYGSWNSLRPLSINNSTGSVLFENGLEGNLKGNADTLDGCHSYDFQKNIGIHSTIDLKSGSFYDCILGKINEGFRGGKIEINGYCPSDSCNGNYWGFIEWTCNENKFAHLVFYFDRWEVVYVREISFNEGTDTGWKIIGDGCNAETSKSVLPTGFGDTSLTYWQGENFYDYNGWCHYLIANHGGGEHYYNYVIGLPFWDSPMYKRQTGTRENTSGWQKFYTTENITYGTSGLTAGSSNLSTGSIYLQYE